MVSMEIVMSGPTSYERITITCLYIKQFSTNPPCRSLCKGIISLRLLSVPSKFFDLCCFVCDVVKASLTMPENSESDSVCTSVKLLPLVPVLLDLAALEVRGQFKSSSSFPNSSKVYAVAVSVGSNSIALVQHIVSLFSFFSSNKGRVAGDLQQWEIEERNLEKRNADEDVEKLLTYMVLRTSMTLDLQDFWTSLLVEEEGTKKTNTVYRNNSCRIGSDQHPARTRRHAELLLCLDSFDILLEVLWTSLRRRLWNSKNVADLTRCCTKKERPANLAGQHAFSGMFPALLNLQDHRSLRQLDENADSFLESGFCKDFASLRALQSWRIERQLRSKILYFLRYNPLKF